MKKAPRTRGVWAVEAAQKNWIVKRAKQQSVSEAEVVRELIAEAMSRHKKKKQ